MATLVQTHTKEIPIAILAPTYPVAVNKKQRYLKIANKRILNERLESAGFSELIYKTDIITKLAGAVMTSLNVSKTAEECLISYIDWLQDALDENADYVPTVPLRKDLLVKAVLQDYPEAIEELRSYGVLPEKD